MVELGAILPVYHGLFAGRWANRKWTGEGYDTAKVKVGDSVTAGQEIAGVGTTGYSTGPHLHYQVMFNGENVDGMSLIDFSDKLPKPSFGSTTPSYPGLNPQFRP